jgi:hypothetical protein
MKNSPAVKDEITTRMPEYLRAAENPGNKVVPSYTVKF